MTNLTNLLGLSILSLSIGCAVDTTEAPDLPAPQIIASTHVSMLRQAQGQWVERKPFLDDAMRALCDGCAIAVSHDLRLDGSELVDRAVVFVEHSTVAGIADGTPLCKRERAYASAIEQPFPNGELVDYRLIADTCVSDFSPSVLESYSLWVPSTNVEIFEVMDGVPPPNTAVTGYRPFARWTRIEPARGPLASTIAP